MQRARQDDSFGAAPLPLFGADLHTRCELQPRTCDALPVQQRTAVTPPSTLPILYVERVDFEQDAMAALPGWRGALQNALSRGLTSNRTQWPPCPVGAALCSEKRIPPSRSSDRPSGSARSLSPAGNQCPARTRAPAPAADQGACDPGGASSVPRSSFPFNLSVRLSLHVTLSRDTVTLAPAGRPPRPCRSGRCSASRPTARPDAVERLRDHHDFETLVRQNHNWMVQTRRIDTNLVVASVRTIFSDAGRRGSTLIDGIGDGGDQT